MKAILLVLVCLALAGAALFAPIGGRSFWRRAQERGIPRATAVLAARGLRAGWDFLALLQHRAPTGAGPTREGPPHSPRHLSRRAQAAPQPPLHRASREGIVPQPPKEKLEHADRAALDKLVAGGR
jgi:hypothetical protein